MTERGIYQTQVADMGLLQNVHGATLRNKVRNCEIRKALNVESFEGT